MKEKCLGRFTSEWQPQRRSCRNANSKRLPWERSNVSTRRDEWRLGHGAAVSWLLWVVVVVKMESGVGGPGRWAFPSSNIRKTPRHGC